MSEVSDHTSVRTLTAFHREGSPGFPKLKLWGFPFASLCVVVAHNGRDCDERNHSASNQEKDLEKQEIEFGAVQQA